MAITVGVDTYISAADASAYCTLMDLPQLSDAETLLKRATKALDRIYGPNYIGTKQTSSNPLLWPRYVPSGLDAYNNDTDFSSIPSAVAEATVELAVLMDAGQSVFTQPSQGVTSESISIDVISISNSYAGSQGSSEDPLYSVTLALRPVLISSGTIKLVR